MSKILGQLEKAQFENIVGNAATALAVGRFWADITTVTKAIPKFYNGTQVMQLAMANFNAIGNSGAGAINIDWSLGTTQTLTLTGNVVATHLNMPTNGQLCTLIVVQASAVPLFNIRFTTDNYWQKKVVPGLIPIGSSAKFEFISTAAFLAATTVLGNYVSADANAFSGFQHICFSPDGQTIYYTGGGGNLTSMTAGIGPLGGLQFGVPLSIGTVSPTGNVRCVAVHPSGMYVAVGTDTTPFVQVFPVSFGNFAQALTAPVALPPAAVNAVAWSPAGDAIVWSSGTTPFIGGYKFTDGVFGAAYSNPGTAAAAAHSIKFHPGGLFVAAGLDAAPGICAYAFTSAGGFGTKSAAPAPATFLAVQGPDAVAFSPDGLTVGFVCTATPFVHAWPFSAAGAFGTVIANPGTLPAAAPLAMEWSYQNDYVYLAVASGATVIYAYPWTTLFGTLGTNATTLPPTASLNGLRAHPTGEFLAWFGATTPFLGSYLTPRTLKNFIARQY